MSKLVKLTSDTGRNVSSNSFTCTSDDDIIIGPNSVVSLLNAHISSGILSNYTIKSEDMVGNVAGEILGSLYLTTDTSDRKRDIVLKPGDYSINPLLSNVTDAFNSSLIFNSETRMTSTTSNTLNTPANLDFGLGVICTLDDSKRVDIRYNSAPQKETVDLAYSNKNDGINIDGAGNITYATPTNYASLSLDTSLADNTTHQVYSLSTQPSIPFSEFDSVTLTDATGANILSSQIITITNAGENVVNALALDTTGADVPNTTVYTSNPYTNITDAKFKVGDSVTLDDGAGVLGTPSQNTTYAEVADIELLPLYENYEVEEISAIVGFNTFADNAIASTVINADGTFNITLDVPYADAADNHIITDGVFILLDTLNNIDSVCQVLSVNQVVSDPNSTMIVVTAQPFGKKINYIAWFGLKTYELISSNNNSGSAITDTDITPGTNVQVFNNNVPLFQGTVYVVTFNNVENSFKIEFIAGSLACLSDDGLSLLTGIDATIKIAQIVTDPSFDVLTVLTAPYDRVISKNPLDITQISIANTTPVEIKDNVSTIDTLTTISSPPYDFTNTSGTTYVVFPISYTQPDVVSIYKASSQFVISLSQSSTTSIYKTNANTILKLVLDNATQPVNNLAICTRIWAGVDVTNTLVFTLSAKGAINRFNLNIFDTMLLGTNIKPQNESFCVEDTRITHSCGRVSFLLNSLGNCSFGLMPETFNFANQSPLNNDIRVAIESTGNATYYQLYRGTIAVPLKTRLTALVGDRIVIQYGISPSIYDNEYTDAVNGATNPAAIINNTNIYTGISTGELNELDRNKILVSVVRTGQQNNYIYLGCVENTPNMNSNPQRTRARTIPWTPRNHPYLEPQYFNTNANLHVYVSPNQASIRILELTPDPTITTVDGKTAIINGDHALNDSSIHTVTNNDLVGQFNKYGSFQNVFNFIFSDINLQKQLGYKSSTNVLTGLTGHWAADITYLNAYLPENLVIFLDNITNVQTYDLN